MAKLILNRLSKSFGGGKPAVNDVSMTIREGGFLALLGPSGCGKTTVLRMIAGFEQPTDGAILLGDRVLADAGSMVPPERRNMAMVFQSYALWPHMTVADNAGYPLKVRSISGETYKRKVADALATVRLEAYADRRPSELSGGQRQRVALGRAMVRRPAVFLMDEPLYNLDANLRVHARGEIVELHRRAGVPTVYVTHDQAEALSMADRVAVMIGGSLLQLAPPAVIYDDPRHIEVAKFVGQPRINLLPALVGTDGTVGFGEARCGLSRIDVAAASSVTLGIRPEFVSISRDGRGSPATVERVEFLGSEIIVYSRLEQSGDTMIAKLTPAEGAAISTGKRIHLAAAPERLFVFAEDGRRLFSTPLVDNDVRERAYG